MRLRARFTVVGAIARAFFTGLVRDRTGMFFVVVLPVVIIVVIGSVFGAVDAGEVGVLDNDRTELSRRLTGQLDADSSVVVRNYEDERELRRDVRTGRIDAGLVIPDGLEADAELNGGPATVALVADPSRQSASAVRPAIDEALTLLGQQVTARRFVAGTVGVGPEAADELVAAARQATAPVAVEAQTIGADSAANSGFSYTAPSNLVLFVFVNSLAAAGALVQARRGGLTRRMLAAPVTVGTVLLGTGATHFLFTLGQALLIIVVGGVLFGVSWGAPMAVAALVLVWCLVSAGAGLLIGAVARTPDHAQSIGIPVAISLGMLGGCMWPLEIVGETMRQVGHASPHAWAMDAWIDLVLDGEGLGEIAPELGVLAIWAVVLLVAATFLLGRMVRRA